VDPGGEIQRRAIKNLFKEIMFPGGEAAGGFEAISGWKERAIGIPPW